MELSMQMKNVVSKPVAKKALNVCLTLAFLVCILCISQSDFACTDIWTKSQTTAQEIYGKVRDLASYIAGTLFIIALGVSFFSKDERKVDVAWSWAKRIFFTYLLILGAGYVFAYGRELMESAPDVFTGVNPT